MGAGLGPFIVQAAIYFSTAFGVVIGASLMTGIASILTLEPPSTQMEAIARNMKIWAVVAAIGGTIDPFRQIETNLFLNHYSPVVKQLLLFVVAFVGASMGTRLIEWICSGGGQP